MGSPPHMRGKVILSFFVRGRGRITPAHAGKSSPLTFAILSLKDHPRTCGEKRKNPELMFFPVGSPPHMRGKDILGDTEAIAERITPAHAGKSYKQKFPPV